MAIQIFLLILISIIQVSSFSVGVPPAPKVCKGMTPQHGTITPQTSEPPYAITIEPTSVEGGDFVTVNLKSTSQFQFMGFYVQGRNDKGNPIGTFHPNAVAETHSCGGIRWNAAYHANGHEEKDVASIRWKAPTNYEGEVIFIATFVQNFAKIWTGVYGAPITVTQTTTAK